jgi:hypothetical protein
VTGSWRNRIFDGGIYHAISNGGTFGRHAILYITSTEPGVFFYDFPDKITPTEKDTGKVVPLYAGSMTR